MSDLSQDPKDLEIAALRAKVEQLQPRAEEFQLMVENVHDHALVRFDPSGRVTGWSRGAEQMMGYQEQEVLGRHSAALFAQEDVRAGEPEREIAVTLQSGRAEDERWHVRKDGTRFWGSGVMTAMRSADGQLRGYFKIVRDLTIRKSAEEAVRRSEDQLRRFIDNVKDYALLQIDPNNLIASWNVGAQRMFGYEAPEVLNRPVSILFTSEDCLAEVPSKDLETAASEGRSEDERWMVRKDKTCFISRGVITPIRDEAGELLGFAKVLRDETERHRSEEQLRASLLERETLLKEIHHRVKNNLQVIVSLLSLQSDQIQDPLVRSVFRDTESRVRAIARIHETLYSSVDLARIEFGQYTRNLVHDLFSFYDVPSDRIRLEVETADLVLDITQAIPLGLILNELVVNSLKHAFPEDRSGTVTVKLNYVDRRRSSEQTLDEGMGQLSVQDDGIGMPEGLSIETATSMGIYLVRVLAQQLRGTLALQGGAGTRFAFTFPLAEDHAGVRNAHA